MTLPTPTPPECIAKALAATEWVDTGMGNRERIEDVYVPEAVHLVRAQAVWNALLTYGERRQVIGQMFYDDTDEGEPVLVVPLARHNPNKDAT